MYMMGQKRKQTCFVDLKRMEKAIVNNRKRIKEIDRLIERICEDNVNGKLSDERSITMSGNYEAERPSRRCFLSVIRRASAKQHYNKEGMRICSLPAAGGAILFFQQSAKSHCNSAVNIV